MLLMPVLTTCMWTHDGLFCVFGQLNSMNRVRLCVSRPHLATGPIRTVVMFQISPLTKEEEGSYECYATNSKGEASAVGAIHVVESIADIITKKGNNSYDIIRKRTNNYITVR